MRSIAIYLPQFHPIPENNKWWGNGFTEWTNVAKSVPLFKNHNQPNIPADLGFYDLRLPETRIAQAEMAKAHNISGFCYYHYWFSGHRLIERPFNEVLNSKEPDFPFCLCWANETWSRRWLGEERNILIKQDYSEKDDYNHIHWLLNAFADDRYIKINNRPVFIIYRPTDLPDVEKTIEIFKNESVKKGMPEPYFIGSNSHCGTLNLLEKGFDGILNFEPQLSVLEGFMDDEKSFKKLRRNLKLGVRSNSLKVYDYNEAKDLMEARKFDYPSYPCVFVGWDNTPRRGKNGIIIVNQNPERFEKSLQKAKNLVKNKPKDEQIVFINAWNEWAEGNHLEPNLSYGTTYLEAVKKIFS